MNRSLAAINEHLQLLERGLTLADAARIDQVFNDYPDFWVDPETDRRLRTTLLLELESLLGEVGNPTSELVDGLIRNQAGVPSREEDTDPIYRDYGKRSGDVLVLPGDETEIEVLGPCPASPFRWALVMDLKTQFRWPMSWVVINELGVKRSAPPASVSGTESEA